MRKTTILRKISLLSLVLVSNLHLFGQAYYSQFKELVLKKDTIGQYKLLKKWEVANPDDPELYVAAINFYVQRSRKEVLSLKKEQEAGSSIEMKNQANEAVGYLTGKVIYESNDLDSGFYYINKGISKFPDRLDMRFGKTYVLGLTENYRAFTEEIIKTVEYSGQINNQWKWSESKPLNDAKNFMLGSVQDYVFQLYEVKDDNIIPYIGSIAESVLKLYPDHVESLSNLSITYLVKKEYDNALIPLLKAEKLSPKDYIVLSNIAWCYYQKKDKLNAIKYYELVLKYGDEGAMNFANEKLVELKKSN